MTDKREENIPRIVNNNSNIHLYSRKLSDQLKKDRYPKKKHYHINIPEAIDAEISFYPYDDIDFQFDFQKFCGTLDKQDAEMFEMYTLGAYYQSEIADRYGLSQSTVSLKLKLLVELFNEFYFEEK